MMAGMERDEVVQFPTATPGTGDNLLYATDPNLETAAAQATLAPQVAGNVLGTRRVKSWFQANQASTAKLEVYDFATKTWVVVNNGGAGDSVLANAWYEVNFLRPAGPHRFVVNFTVAPTSWKHPDTVRLQIYT